MPLFAEAEHRERLIRARRALAAAGFAGAVVVAPEHLYSLAGYDSWISVNSPQVLIFGTGGDEPTLVLRPAQSKSPVRLADGACAKRLRGRVRSPIRPT
jgi:Xaa-Pro aminopeptidase